MLNIPAWSLPALLIGFLAIAGALYALAKAFG